MPKVNPDIQTSARITVVGLGGSGKNAVNHMINSNVSDVEFICMNTDVQDLHNSLAEKKIHIGRNLTKGRGTGMNPEIGRQSADETQAEIQEALKGSDLLFIACGMGGGTGTGSAPVVARVAKEQDILTVAVVTKPFFFEGERRQNIAREGLERLEKEVDAVIVIPNDRLLDLAGDDTSFNDTFAMCDEVLRQAVEGISELITTPGTINIDFADIKTILQNAGAAFMGVGSAAGEKRAENAAMQAINSPLLDLSIRGAKGVLFSISAGDDLTMREVQTIANIVTESIDVDAKVIFGTIKDAKLKKGEIKVTVIATGFEPGADKKKSLFEAKEPKKETREPAIEVEQPIIRRDIPDTAVGEPKIKKVEVIDDENPDEWSAVPAFLRRNSDKK
ncbi:MAG: cell division protein FtsZ [Candidatus Pacebacteria bacterium]|nr:cell division protein FtsZ [Candidatus Paceibacterota bacterium]MCD8508303.1 cell division protein FtsZ [Candidatus Paceibacterota bacterium]MCD8528365.1 cell division protein FtsZ [Candidatus Paceibacterota bacterium]MCD8563664.1 cell division protein FtsZ [Candidatus Paceibacterota bacterium]